MPIHKEHKEFFRPDPGRGWETPAGYPSGIQQQILAGALDEKNKHGHRTRHLRFAPGVYTTEPFVHDYWEEVYLVSGDLIVGNEGRATGANRAQYAACRPPGTCTGRSSPESGCLLVEVHYYDEKQGDFECDSIKV